MLAPRLNRIARFLLSMNRLSLFDLRKRKPWRAFSCLRRFSQPDAVSFGFRSLYRAPAKEFPDTHFDVKQFTFRVTSWPTHYPVEEVPLRRSSDPNGHLHRLIGLAQVRPMIHHCFSDPPGTVER